MHVTETVSSLEAEGISLYLQTHKKMKKVGQILTAMGKRDSPAQTPSAGFSASCLCLANLGTDDNHRMLLVGRDLQKTSSPNCLQRAGSSSTRSSILDG